MCSTQLRALENTSIRLRRRSARNYYWRYLWEGWRPCPAGKLRGYQSSRQAFTSWTQHIWHTTIGMRCAWSPGTLLRPYRDAHSSAPGTMHRYSRMGESRSDDSGGGRQRSLFMKRWGNSKGLKSNASAADGRRVVRSPWHQSLSTERISSPRSGKMQSSYSTASTHWT